jgi:PmbA protein
MGKQVAASAITVTDDPFVSRGPASRPFDGEGVAGEPLTMVENGVLKHWFLSTSVAREIGLETNGRASRSSASVSPSATNLAIEPGPQDPKDLIGGISRGFYVTELFGHGTNMITGEFSRGAGGFMIENGEITHPVSEVTIAANLKDMFMNMTPASDIDRNYARAAPTLLVEGMTLAGR